MGKEVIVNNDNFENEVIKSDKTVLIDFWAAWCGPCKMVAPTIEQIAEEYSDKLKICKCDVDQNENLAMKYEIRSIPTLLVFKDGKEVKRSTGALPKERIINLFIDLI
ncbi:MAG: thioredoxin [Spirochaetes bacterium]|nr:thioredoxin [Spirochaetota bacterium]